MRRPAHCSLTCPNSLGAQGRIAVKYYIEPVTGFLTIDALLSGEKGAFGSAVSHLILPMIVLGTNPLAIIARMTRSAMLEVLGEDYIRTARAKGLSQLRVVALHAAGDIAGAIAVCTGVSETSGIFLPSFAVAAIRSLFLWRMMVGVVSVNG